MSGPLSRAAVRELVNDLENYLHVSLDPKLARLGREGHSLRLLMRSLLGYMRAVKKHSCSSWAAAAWLFPSASTTALRPYFSPVWSSSRTGS